MTRNWFDLYLLSWPE